MNNKFNLFYEITSYILTKSKDEFNYNNVASDTDPDRFFILSGRKKEDFCSWTLFDLEKNKIFAENYLRKLLASDKIKEELINDYIDFIFSSYCSFFKIISIKDEYAHLKDLILNTEIIAYDPDHLITDEFDYYFLRLGNSPDENYLVVSKLNSFQEDFAEALIGDVNDFLNFKKIRANKFVDIKKILKEDLINIFYIYGSCLANFANELQEKFAFEQFLNFVEEAFSKEDASILDDYLKVLSTYEKSGNLSTDEAIYYLHLFYNEYMVKNSMNFSSYSKINFEKIYYSLCEKGEFVNLYELKNSLRFYKNYYNYLTQHKRTNKTDKLLKSLQKSNENIFLYQNLLKNSLSGYFVDNSLVDIVEDSGLAKPSFINNFENFIDYIQYSYVYNVKTGQMSPSVVKSISTELGLMPTKNVKTLREYHFPELKIFLKFAELKNIVCLNKDNEFNDGLYEISEKAYRYLSLDQNEKFALWLSTLMNHEFYQGIYKESTFVKMRTFIIKLLFDIDGDLLDKDFKIENNYLPLVKILVDLGIIKGLDNLSFTNFGREIFKYFNKIIPEKNIININFNNKY